jgi:pimeloyl-ACP methyl ester carboxylesterase
MDREQMIAVWDGGVRMRVLSAGAGPALVFLHGPWGSRGIRFSTI